MKELPSYILRNCAIWVNRDAKVGQAESITVPAPKVKTEELRNAGMVKPREINLGYEAVAFSFKMTAMDPATLLRFGLFPGVETEFMVSAALVDEDTTTHSAVLFVRGMMKGLEGDDWGGKGDMVTHGHEVSVNYYKLEIDGSPIYEIDDFDIKVGGVSQYAAIRAAMLL